MKHILYWCCLLLFVNFTAAAQTEFPKEFILHGRLYSGFIAVPKTPELFVAQAQVIPQYTLIPYHLRGGLIAGGYYTGRKVFGEAGVTLSYKLAELKGGYFGSIGNLFLSADHLWAGGSRRLIGGGLNLDLANKLVVGIAAHRDYRQAAWWGGTSVAVRLSKVKKSKETFPN